MTQSKFEPKRGPVLGCIADDVTGATDLAINLVQGGMRVVQVLGVPDAEVLSRMGDVDAVVVALKSRSIAKEDAIGLSIASLQVLKHLGIERFYFKYCSTFDSTEHGNIGPVAEALMHELDVPQTIFCPAFPRAGRTVYRGHLFVGDSLLSESGMQNHPLNPMTDSNLVRFLAKQTSRKVGLLPSETIDESFAACVGKLMDLKAEGTSLVVTDACSNVHLATLAQSLTAMPLVTGGSGLARYLPNAYRDVGLCESTKFEPELPNLSGRSLILAGSCSIATNGQVQWMRLRCPTWQLDTAAVIRDASSELSKLMTWAASTEPDEILLVTSTAAPNTVSALQKQFGAAEVAAAIERFMGRVATSMVDQLGVRRLVLAGGETSGAVVRDLGIGLLRIGPEICAGVPWTQTIGRDPELALALKSGNFGDETFFASALEMLP